MSYYSNIRRKIDFCKEQHRRLYTYALYGQWTDSELWAKRNESIYNTKEYSSLPRWAQSELTGFFDAKRQQFYDEYTVFCHVIDGIPHTIPEYRALETDNPDIHRQVALAKDYGTFWKESRKPFHYTGPE